MRPRVASEKDREGREVGELKGARGRRAEIGVAAAKAGVGEGNVMVKGCLECWENARGTGHRRRWVEREAGSRGRGGVRRVISNAGKTRREGGGRRRWFK